MDQALDPSVIHRRRRNRLLVAVGLMAAFCATAWAINRVVSPAIAVSDVMVSVVRRGDIANTINASGVVIPVHEELVSSPILSHVTKVHAKLGQQVAAGEVLLELDDHVVKLALDSLKEQLAQQENRVVGLTLEMDQKRKQLSSSIELLELDLRSAKAKWERNVTLRKSGAVSAEDMLTAELNVKRNEIQLRQQHELIEDNRHATQSNVDGAILQKNILLKQIEQQQQLLAQAQVRSPFAGIVTSLMSEEGASVMVGQLVAKVSELNNYRVEASVSDFHANLLNPGQLVRVEQANQTLTGHVSSILPEIQNGTIKLLIALDQANHPALRNKMRVDVNIITEQKTGALIVDNGPAFNGKGRQAAFIIKNGVAVKSVVDMGGSDGKAVEITSGAQVGDRIIVSDISRFKDRDSIRVSQ